MNDYPIVLRAEDTATPPPDPQTATAGHRDEIRALLRETRYLVDLLTHAPAGALAATLTAALHRAVDIDRRADELDRSAEALALSHRLAGTYSARYSVGARP